MAATPKEESKMFLLVPTGNGYYRPVYPVEDDYAKCESCKRELHPLDNILNRFCDPTCADSNEPRCFTCKKITYECSCYE